MCDTSFLLIEKTYKKNSGDTIFSLQKRILVIQILNLQKKIWVTQILAYKKEFWGYKFLPEKKNLAS